MNKPTPLKIWIGYDEAEHSAAMVCAESVRRATNGEIEPTFLKQDVLRACGLYTRPETRKGAQRWDTISDAPCSTAFSLTRFLTPILAQSGYALFIDCDMVVYSDPRDMITEANMRSDDWALACVKHRRYTPAEKTKMMGLRQTAYRRKNWSSVMLFNCDNPGMSALSLDDVNRKTGSYLHQLDWMDDDMIVGLNDSWNQLVGVRPTIRAEGIVHFTNGGPWFEGWPGGPYDQLWLDAAASMGLAP